MKDERGELITVTEAVKVLGCGRWGVSKILRKHLDAETGLSVGGRVEGKMIANHFWLVYRHTVEAAAASGMSWCAGRKRGEKKPGGTKRKRPS
jgi:hypothetical protein